MSEIEDLLKDIKELKKNLNKLIEDKENLTDAEVVAASQILNAAIAKYNEFIKSKL